MLWKILGALAAVLIVGNYVYWVFIWKSEATLRLERNPADDVEMPAP
jgi:hypothetical protein